VGDLKDELRSGARSAIGAAIGAGVAAFAKWVWSRPLQRAIARRRARRAPPAPQGRSEARARDDDRTPD